MANRPFRFWPEEQKAKIIQEIKDYWMSDPELTKREVVERFHRVGVHTVTKILNDTDDPPKERVKRRGFGRDVLLNIKTPDKVPWVKK